MLDNVNSIDNSQENKDYGAQVIVDQLEVIIDDSLKYSNEVFAKLDDILDVVSKGQNNILDNADVFKQIQESVFDIMTAMQFQDIYKQKIERIIDSLIIHFSEEDIEVVSKEHAPSAKHISGDKDTDDLVSDDELAQLIAEWTV